MKSVTSLVYEYRELEAQRSVTPWALSVADNQRLGALGRAFEARDGGRRQYARKPVIGSGELHVGLARTELDIMDLGVGGAKVGCALPLATGQRAVLRVFDPRTGATMDFQCEVAWRGPATLGLRFFGAPALTPPLPQTRQMARSCTIGW